MLAIDLTGKRALVAGVADDHGFGFAIAKALAEAGATIAIATWPPAYGVLTRALALGKLDRSLALAGGGKLELATIIPLDADFDTADDIPAALRESRRYRDHGDVSVAGAAERLRSELGEGGLDIVVHSLANGPEVSRPLLATSRAGYLAAVSTSSYSFTSMVQRFGPLMPRGSAFLALSYLASQRVVTGYGGGMAAAKAALEADARMLAFEAGRTWGHRVNILSAGAYRSRAAAAIDGLDQMIDHAAERSPLPEAITATEVGAAAAFLCSPLAAGITATTVYVDKGYHAMGIAVDREGAAQS